MNITWIKLDEQSESALQNIRKKEKKSLNTLLKEAITSYISQHEETFELLSDPKVRRTIRKGKSQVRRKVKGVLLDELDD